ncbi:MAG: hypothetical protein BWY61_00903 [Firmicutes bacterium ADurb.Bin354]|nr:MAG: hypothetical protein BWY61_00903 [Firmicutes bacterium ADurb.Bin354]
MFYNSPMSFYSGEKYYRDTPIDFGGSSGHGRSASEAAWDYVRPASTGRDTSGFGSLLSTEKDSSDSFPPDTPDEIRALWKECRSESVFLLRNESFYRQALMMKDFKDAYEPVPYSAHFPVFANMKISQMRSYFSFRREARRSVFLKVSPAYIYVYVYEILCGIGIRDDRQAYDMLEELADAYKNEYPALYEDICRWMKDYAVYHGMQDEIDSFFEKEKISDKNIEIIFYPEKYDKEKIFEAVCEFSAYKIDRSVFYRKYPDTVKIAVVKTVDVMNDYYQSLCKRSFFEYCFGLMKQNPYRPFNGAVFYSPDKIGQAEIRIDPVRVFRCREGIWTLSSYNAAGKNKALGIVLRKLDRQLRIAYGFSRELKDNSPDPLMDIYIKKAVEATKQEEYIAEHPPIEVDLSKLEGIRSDADVIREALLTEEERDVRINEEVFTPESVDESHPKAKAPLDPFTETEICFLRLISQKGDWRAFLKEKHIMEGVMVDSVNAKFLDIIGDSAIEECNGEMSIIPDYEDDVRGYI